MNRHMVFQFSSIKNTENFQRIKKIFNEIKINYDDSKNYSEKSTHLLVDQIDSTEKILCFIAAGKWILRVSYVKDSLHAKKWLDEKHYHVSTKFPSSKLANVSLKWMEKINESKLWPFLNWYVLCILNDEKCDALIRIIEAGNGRAYQFNKENAIKYDNYTLIIYNESTKSIAEDYSKMFKIPCYPYQAIPDYLMQAEYSKKPLLSVSYYVHEPEISSHVEEMCIDDDNNNYEANKENLIDFDENLKINTKFFSSYSTYLLLANSKEDYTFVDSEFANTFTIMFENNSFLEALDLLYTLKPNEVPLLEQLNCLIRFIMRFDGEKRNQNFTAPSKINETMEYIYNSIYSYLLNLLLNNPPISSKLKRFYKKVFENINFKLFCEFYDSSDAYILVDVLYLLSVHDYLILNLKTSDIKYKDCALLYCRVDNEIIKILLNKLIKNKKQVNMKTFHRLLQITSFKNHYFKEDNKNSYFIDYIKDTIKQSNKTIQLSNFFLNLQI